MVFYNLRVGSFMLKYTPLKPLVNNYPYCDDKGNLLKKVIEKSAISYFVDDNGNKHQQAFRLINNKPMAKLSKTKEVDNYKEVGNEEVDDLIIEKVYFVECDSLYKELSDSEKSLKFAFTFGNGFKVYKAYIHTNKLYKGFLFMSVGTTQKSEVLKEITETQKLKTKSKQVDLVIQGVDKASVEDLIKI